MQKSSPLYQPTTACAVLLTHEQSLGCRIFSKKLNPNITREEGCDQEEGKDGYACLVRKLQLDETKARQVIEKTKKARSGAKQGLQVILDQHSNLDSVATHFDADNSFKVFVGRSTDIFPKRGTNRSPDFTISFKTKFPKNGKNKRQICLLCKI